MKLLPWVWHTVPHPWQKFRCYCSLFVSVIYLWKLTSAKKTPGTDSIWEMSFFFQTWMFNIRPNAQIFWNRNEHFDIGAAPFTAPMAIISLLLLVSTPVINSWKFRSAKMSKDRLTSVPGVFCRRQFSMSSHMHKKTTIATKFLSWVRHTVPDPWQKFRCYCGLFVPAIYRWKLSSAKNSRDRAWGN